MNSTQLTNCHAQLAPLLGLTAQPLAVTKLVEQHRWFWRPAHPRLILLAESHVYTTEAETQCLINANGLPPGVPAEFVRLIYCLGYGENAILNRSIAGKNTGTPQFWKIYWPGLAKLNAQTRHAAITLSWDHYVRLVVSEANPQAILCIGIGVARTLSSRLNTLEIPWDAVPQPQAHPSAQTTMKS